VSRRGGVSTAADVASAAQLACLLEASAPKPGNVFPGAPFRDTSYAHFLASAAAIGPAFLAAAGQPLGATIRAAVQATARWTRTNTNLGIVLLLAPLARAALDDSTPRASLRERVARVLHATTVRDAVEAYAAIRLARPAGLGRAAAQDVRSRPTRTLLQAMRLAAARDGVAREYATGFATTFDVGVPALAGARAHGLAWEEAIVETYLTLLAHAPDTHIARKLGAPAARAVSGRAGAVLEAGGVRTGAGRIAIVAFDRELRDPANARNPGTTADLAAAAIFAVLLDGGWS